MTITRYNNSHDIDVAFEDGTLEKNTTYSRFKNGSVINYNIPSYLNIGYRGYGKYKTRNNNIKTDEYIKWGSMLTRCYSKKHKYRENYIGCYVCDNWLNFQNFADWYNKNKYSLPNDEKLELDKDIRVKGNKIYSPDTCLLVPKRINDVILNRKNDRGKYLIGVKYNEKNKKYIAMCNVDGNVKYIESFNSESEAYIAYKSCKEEEIHNVCKKYKNIVPSEILKIVLNYKIDEND